MCCVPLFLTVLRGVVCSNQCSCFKRCVEFTTVNLSEEMHGVPYCVPVLNGTVGGVVFLLMFLS